LSRIAQRQQAAVKNEDRPSRRVTDTAISDPGSPSQQDVEEDEEDSTAETPTQVGSQESLPDISSPAAELIHCLVRRQKPTRYCQ
jgi:hypothetical protein